mmetsp:Transcript_10286/g.15553  ORF Transcript_10286/g.15553 Transcript_10286/m.15553 type:complete len:298 (+) Transcript_10286:85-978(+)
MSAEAVQDWESWILSTMAVNWMPSSGFDHATQRMTFDVAVDLARIPTREFPVSHLNEAICVLLAYICIVLFGKCLFFVSSKRTKAFIPEPILYAVKFGYNFGQIILCSYMFVESVMLVRRNNYGLIPMRFFNCNSFNFAEPVIHKLLWLFYVSKIFDFFDTIFIILGNKRQQFTFLHCYHHMSIFSLYWLNLNMLYDADIVYTITLNAFVHAVMYSYYLICMHLPKDRKYSVWWKKYLTVIQLVQFCFMLADGALLIISECPQIPIRISKLYFTYILSLFVLFMNFFSQSYSKKKKE